MTQDKNFLTQIRAMMIEDEELRLLYKTSSSEHLQKLESDLMILEKNPQNTAALEEFLREAHTLKGDSRMLGLEEIETLVHHLESCVEEIKAGQEEITPELCDRLYLGIDAVNQLAHQAITGEAVSINTQEILAVLTGEDASTEQTNAEASFFDDEADFFGEASGSLNVSDNLFDDDADFFEEASSSRNTPGNLFDDEEDFFEEVSSPSDTSANLFDDEDDFFDGEELATGDMSGAITDATELFVQAGEIPLPAQPITATPEPSKLAANAKSLIKPTIIGNQGLAQQEFSIDTIRVEPQKLDNLMTHSSELGVTKLRVLQNLKGIEQIVSLWETWSRQSLLEQSLREVVTARLEPEEVRQFDYFWQKHQHNLDSLGSLIQSLQTRAGEDSASLNIISDRLESGIQNLRQLPLSTVFNVFPRMVRDLARLQGKNIDFVIEGGNTKADKLILEEIRDPLLHLLRNAIDHGIETPQERLHHGKEATARIILRGYQTGNSIGVEISDDGWGLSLEKIAHTALRRGVCTQAELDAMSDNAIQSLIFASGFSTRTEVTELSGRGVGLDVVRANVERLKGSIEVTSEPGQGCKFQVLFGTNLATTKVLIVEVSQTLYAVPLEFVQTIVALTPQDIYQVEGKSTITLAEQPLSIAPLNEILGITSAPESATQQRYFSCVILQVGDNTFGIIVDDLVDQQDIVVKPHSKLLKRVPNISGATILGSGEVCMILNPSDLLHSLSNGSWQRVSQTTAEQVTRNRLLLVEDSIIIRTQMQRLLKGAGYQVTVAEDGQAGLEHLQQGEQFDIILSDVEMPRMSGLEMTTKIRQDSNYSHIPIILITTLASTEARNRGLAAGANAYLTKGDFDQELLFSKLDELLQTHAR